MLGALELVGAEEGNPKAFFAASPPALKENPVLAFGRPLGVELGPAGGPTVDVVSVGFGKVEGKPKPRAEAFAVGMEGSGVVGVGADDPPAPSDSPFKLEPNIDLGADSLSSGCADVVVDALLPPKENAAEVVG